MNPSFQIGQAIGTNVGNAFKNIRDKSALDEILENANRTNDPNAINDAMSQILSRVSPERQQAALGVLQQKQKMIQDRIEKDKEAKKLELGRQARIKAGFEPDLEATLAKEAYKTRQTNELLGQLGLGANPQQTGNETAEMGKGSAQPQPAKSFQDLEDAELSRLSVIPQLQKTVELEAKRREKEQAKYEGDRTFHSKSSDPIVAAANTVLKSAPVKKGLINQHRRDIASGNVTGLGPFLADKTGWEVFRNPEAARARSAAKQYFIQSLNSLATGARPNIFLEQQLSAGQTQIGREEEANQTVLDLMEFTDDLETERAKYIRDLAEEDREKYGYVKNDVDARADKKMIPYAEQREDEMAYTIRKRHEDEKDDAALIKEIFTGKVPEGTPLTIRAARILDVRNNHDEKKALAEAKKLGFIIPSEETILKLR